MADKPNNSDYFVTMDQNDTSIQGKKGQFTRAGDPTGLSELIARATRAGKGIPPVERWEPPFCGDLAIEIKADGSWYYLGTPINRPALVELFSSVLRKDEDGRTYLVTPVEKVGIHVEDAPFVAVEMVVTGRGSEQTITFRTNVGEVVEAGPEHPIRFAEEEGTGGTKPYLLVRGRLEALLARSVMYELMQHCEELDLDGGRVFAVRSNGAVFPIAAVDEMEALTE